MTPYTPMAVDEQPVESARTGLLSQRYDMLWLALGTLLVTVLAFVFRQWGADGRLAPPLDDTFIHFQYARQLAAGHPFEYNTGDPPSSGASSFIYPFLLAPAFLMGLDGQKPLLFADLLNFLAHLGSVLLLYGLALRLGGRPLALFASILLLLDGRLNYIFLSGMETGLFIFSLVAFFWLLSRDLDAGRFVWLAVVGSLAALLRPEGHIIMSVLCVLALVFAWRRAGRLQSQHLWLLVPVMAGLIPYLANLLMTGQLQFNTAASKSIWYLPYAPFYENLSLTAGWAITEVKNTYLGLEIGRSPFPLLALPVAVLGAGVALSGARYRFVHVALVITFLLGTALALMLPPIHFNRYHMPYDFIFLLYLAIGVVALVRLAVLAVGLARTELRDKGETVVLPLHSSRPMWWAGAAVAVMLLPQFVSYFFALGDSARDIYHQQMAFSEWVKQYTAPDARIGVNDTGAHKYISERYVIDLIGLTNNRLQGAYFGGWGTIYDRLAAMPEQERPTHLLIHPNVFLNGVDESVAGSLITPMYSIGVQNPIITAGSVETLYRVNWEYALLSESQTYVLQREKQPLDMLNVGDVADEKRHGYDISARQSTFSAPKSIVTTAFYEGNEFALSESGRRHSGWEEFAVKSVPGQPLTLVSRTRLRPEGEQTVVVSANGRQVGVWKMTDEVGGGWQEYEYAIPAEFVTGDSTVIRLDATADPGGPGFASYRYWVYGP
ncbi:MAG: hypothetical protein M3441_00205 [Chloroflexota bacterium]|nr:hypothetical protein [Chloroflexota bacterium]